MSRLRTCGLSRKNGGGFVKAWRGRRRLEQAAQWRDCGVRYMVLINGGPLQRSLRKGLASVQPFNKIIRGLKRL